MKSPTRIGFPPNSPKLTRRRIGLYILLFFAYDGGVANAEKAYVELHARSAFSFLEGASLPEELASRCAELGRPAMAITDAHGVYGAPQFHLAAKKLGLRALIGAEVNGKENSRYTLLAENRGGYRNVCRLITKTKLREIGKGKGEKHFATEDDLAQHAAGLVCLTGGAEGALARIYRDHTGPDAEERASAFIRLLLQLFGRPNVFIELQRHFCRKQEARNQALVQLARKMQAPLLATNGVAYATAEKRDLQDLLTCVKEKLPISEAGVLLNSNGERHMKTSEQMARLFADLPEAIGNTYVLAQRLQFTLQDLGYQFPRYPVPPGESEMSYLRQLTEIGAKDRFKEY
ncbi:MAG: PHP domain-containing protein, partial [Bryobacteraceae bacterium]